MINLPVFVALEIEARVEAPATINYVEAEAIKLAARRTIERQVQRLTELSLADRITSDGLAVTITSVRNQEVDEWVLKEDTKYVSCCCLCHFWAGPVYDRYWGQYGGQQNDCRFNAPNPTWPKTNGLDCCGQFKLIDADLLTQVEKSSF